MRAIGEFTYDIPEKILEDFAAAQLDSDWKYEYSWEEIIEKYLTYIVEQHAGEFYCTVNQVKR